MTETIDQLIQARFDAVANPLDTGDWTAVLARARTAPYRRRGLPTRLALVAALAVLAVTATAVAFGWPGRVVDFFGSPKAPTHVKDFFGSQNVSAPPGMSPAAIPGEARRITSARFDANHADAHRPTPHTLYVAPRKGGGFCYLWTTYSGSCADARGKPLGVDWLEDDYVLLVSGWIRSGTTKTLQARFADGTTAAIPVTWVSAPIDAGFFLYPVPPAHRTRGDALTSIAALDAQGDVVGSQTFRLTDSLDEDVLQTLPDGSSYSLPRRAEAAKARRIIDFRTTSGSQGYVWVMPRKGGGHCVLTNRFEGCASRRELARLPVLNGGISGSTRAPILFFAQVRRDVAVLELRYQDGTSERRRPVDGFVLTEIAPNHYKPGTRLASVVALDRDGHAISKQREQPQATGVYPCQKPIDLGYGVKSCP